MAQKGKNRFLYLAIACFVGLVAIFVVDGYLGIYDAIYVTAREYEQKIEPDYWLRNYYYDENAYCCIGANWGEKVSFRYEIDNHQFSIYSTHIQASVWQANEKLVDLFSEDASIGPFDNVMVEWTLSSEELEGVSPPAGRSSQYTVRISHGDVERRIIVDFYYSEEGLPPKVVPPLG